MAVINPSGIINEYANVVNTFKYLHQLPYNTFKVIYIKNWYKHNQLLSKKLLDFTTVATQRQDTVL